METSGLILGVPIGTKLVSAADWYLLELLALGQISQLTSKTVSYRGCFYGGGRRHPDLPYVDFETQRYIVRR